VGFVEYSQRPRSARASHFAPYIGVICVKIDADDPDADAGIKVSGIPGYLWSDMGGLNREVAPKVAFPLLNKVRRYDDDGSARHEPTPSALGDVHVCHDGLAGARLICEKKP
jgi:hypothetical protein